MAIDLTLANATLSPATRTNSTVAKPTGVVDGDFLLACVYTEDDIAVTAPVGWNLLVNADSPGTRPIDLHIYYKTASSEGASWTWTHSSTFTSAFVQRMTGVQASGSPEDATRSQNNGTSGGSQTITWTGITTATANSAICGIMGAWVNSTLGAETMTERLNAGNLVLIADIQVSAGATGNKTANWTNDDWLAVLIALKEDDGGGGADPTWGPLLGLQNNRLVGSGLVL